jgi:hypothetical protein
VVGVERGEPARTAVPLGTRDASVAIGVEKREAVAAVIVHRILVEELRARNGAIPVVIGPAESFAIEVPFVVGDAIVPIVIEGAEPAVRPVVEGVFALVVVSCQRSCAIVARAPTRTSSPGSLPSPFSRGP